MKKNYRLHILSFLLIGITMIACKDSKKKVSSQAKLQSTDSCIESNQNMGKNSLANLKESDWDQVIGLYTYIYPENETSIENHYILIEKSGKKLKGRYYGTSDEFDDAREGYLPGYFVADMKDLKLTKSEITFTLEVPNEQILTKQVDLKIKSFDEAIRQGYENWTNDMNLEPNIYIGEIRPNGEIFFKGKCDFMDKLFQKQQ